MKSLIWADLHGHNFREFSTIDGGVNSRLRDCADVVGNILLSAKKEEVDEVWFVGDLFHLKNNLDNQVIQCIMSVMKMLADKFPLYIVPGNHDYRAWSSDPILLEILNEMPGKFILCESGWLKHDYEGAYNCEEGIYIEPFTRKIVELNERIAKLKTDPEKDIFFGHQDMVGAYYGGFQVNSGLDPDILSKKFRWSFVGHNHNPDKYKDNVISVGAPLQHNFGDVGEKRGWWIFDSEKEEMKFIANDFSPKFVDLIMEEDDNIQKLLGESAKKANLEPVRRVPGNPHKDFFRIKVKGTKLPAGLEYIKWKRVSYDVKSQIKKRTTISFSDKKEDILKKYVEARGGDLDHKRLIEIGRKYI